MGTLRAAACSAAGSGSRLPVEFAPSDSSTVATTGLSVEPGVPDPDGAGVADGAADAEGAAEAAPPVDGDGLADATAEGSSPAATSEVAIASRSEVPPRAWSCDKA